jgi:hypothetical protein
VSNRMRTTLLSLALVSGAALALAIGSCSGVPGNAEGAAKKLLHAHGGAAAVARLDDYVGLGFIKDLSSETVARSFAFDVFRKGQLYKHKIMAAPKGALTDVIVIFFDGKTSREWSKGKGITTIPPMELGVLKYRFPDVIAWMQGPDRAGEILPVGKGDPAVRLRYRDEGNVVTLSIDRTSWLLDSVAVAAAGDSTAWFTERYRYYTDVDGIPFPQEFVGSYRGTPYYEYVLSSIRLDPNIPDSLLTVTAEDTAFAVKPPPAEKPAAPKR